MMNKKRVFYMNDNHQKFTIALLQVECILGDCPNNLAHATRLFEKALRQGANFIVLPELFYEGYDLESYTPERSAETFEKNLDMLEHFKGLCAQNSVWAAVPYAEMDGGNLYNALILIDNRGCVFCKYRKTHLWDSEKNCFAPGDTGVCVADTPFGRIALMICYDIDFPEMARTAALKGAEMLILPAAWDYINKDLWEIFLPARAAENMMFVCGVNLFEKNDLSYFFGNCKIINPRGTVLSQLPVQEEGLIVCDINLAEVRLYRKRFPYLTDRRTEFLK